MRPAPAIDALVGLAFNGVAFTADMAMFDFGPLQPKILRYGPRKGETFMVGSLALHVQRSWRLRRNTTVLSGDHFPLRPEAVASANGEAVRTVTLDPVRGDLFIEVGDDFQLTVLVDATDDEQWRLLTAQPDQDHLVWGDDDVQA